jgi:hypothetical protein
MHTMNGRGLGAMPPIGINPLNFSFPVDSLVG